MTKHVVDVYYGEGMSYWDDDPWTVRYSDGSTERTLKYDELPEEAKQYLEAALSFIPDEI